MQQWTLDALKTLRLPRRLGGHLALNFVNTLEFRGTDHAVEFLHGYIQVVEWAHRAGVLTDDQALAQLEQAEHAEDAFQFALALRNALYDLFRAVVEDTLPPPEALALLNRAVMETAAYRHLRAVEESIVWEWSDQVDARRPLWDVIVTAADLLTGETLQHVRQCPNCGWFFVDTSRNHSRRWCSMDFCGSVIKSRRQYERRRAARDN